MHRTNNKKVVRTLTVKSPTLVYCTQFHNIHNMLTEVYCLLSQDKAAIMTGDNQHLIIESRNLNMSNTISRTIITTNITATVTGEVGKKTVDTVFTFTTAGEIGTIAGAKLAKKTPEYLAFIEGKSKPTVTTTVETVCNLYELPLDTFIAAAKAHALKNAPTTESAEV